MKKLIMFSLGNILFTLQILAASGEGASGGGPIMALLANAHNVSININSRQDMQYADQIITSKDFPTIEFNSSKKIDHVMLKNGDSFTLKPGQRFMTKDVDSVQLVTGDKLYFEN